MKNVLANPSTQDSLTKIYSLLEKYLRAEKIPFRAFGDSIGTGLNESMVGRHISRKVTAGCDIFLEELIQAGFEVNIKHPKHPHLKWNSKKDLNKKLDRTEKTTEKPTKNSDNNTTKRTETNSESNSKMDSNKNVEPITNGDVSQQTSQLIL